MSMSASKRYAMATAAVGIGVVRRHLTPRDVGTGNSDDFRVLQATVSDCFIVDRVSLWVDPPITSGKPCFERVIWSFRPVRLLADVPVNVNDIADHCP